MGGLHSSRRLAELGSAEASGCGAAGARLSLNGRRLEAHASEC